MHNKSDQVVSYDIYNYNQRLVNLHRENNNISNLFAFILHAAECTVVQVSDVLILLYEFQLERKPKLKSALTTTMIYYIIL